MTTRYKSASDLFLWGFINWEASWLPEDSIVLDRPARINLFVNHVTESEAFFGLKRTDSLTLAPGWVFQAAGFTPTVQGMDFRIDNAFCPECLSPTVLASSAGVQSPEPPWFCMCESGHIWIIMVTSVTPHQGWAGTEARMRQFPGGALRCHHGRQMSPIDGMDCVVFPEFQAGVVTARFYEGNCKDCYDSPTFQHFVFRIVETPDVSKTDLWLKL